MKNSASYILTVFEFIKVESRVKFRCCGCKELIKVKSILPDYIKGRIEHQGQLIPLIDPGQQFSDCPTAVNENSCAIIFEHPFGQINLRSAFVVESFENILELTLYDFNDIAITNGDPSMSIILDFIRSIDDYTEKILWKNHLLISYLDRKNQQVVTI